MEERLPSYGGQAVIEGVMMRGTKYISMAMRDPDGNIIIHNEELGGIYATSWMKIPFLRGLVGVWDSLVTGIRFLTLSANTQTGEDEKLEGAPLYLTLLVSMVLGIGLFFLLPAGLAQLAETRLHWSNLGSNLLEGVIRLIFLVAYIWAIGFMSDIQRVFQYHGAEHKTINAFEAGAEMIPESVEKYSIEHPRCGTAFLLTLVVFSIVLFALLGPLPTGLRLLSRILLLPVLAAISYEYIRWSAHHLDNRWVRILIQPNLALQHLTTRPPDRQQLEVAIAAFQNMYAQERKQDLSPAS